MAPVASGTTPSQAHGPVVPVAANATNTNPREIRAMRSMPPTFAFMETPFELDYGVADLHPTSE